MPAKLSTALELAGLTGVSVAAFLVATPLGVLVASVCLFVVGLAGERR